MSICNYCGNSADNTKTSIFQFIKDNSFITEQMLEIRCTNCFNLKYGYIKVI